MENKSSLKKSNKIYKDDDGTLYQWNYKEFREAINSFYKMNGITLSLLEENLSEILVISKDTVHNHYRTNNPSNPSDIGMCKKYGEYIKDNEYAFLVKKIPVVLVKDESEGSGNLSKEMITPMKEIYAEIYDILASYESSDSYNFVPYTNDFDHSWEFFGNKLQNVRKKIDISFLGNQDFTDKLNQIVSETEIFVRSYSVPGICERWQSINPNMRFFHLAFELIEENPEIYQKLSSEGNAIGLEYYPTLDEVLEQKKYFEKINKENKQNNFRYSDEKIFQNELLNTLKLVFEKDFKFILN